MRHSISGVLKKELSSLGRKDVSNITKFCSKGRLISLICLFIIRYSRAGVTKEEAANRVIATLWPLLSTPLPFNH